LNGLRTLLVNHPEAFVRTLGEKMLSYAIGRVIESDDLPAVRKIAREAATENYRWSSLVSSIVRSTPFTMGMVEREPSEESVQSTPVHTKIVN